MNKENKKYLANLVFLKNKNCLKNLENKLKDAAVKYFCKSKNFVVGDYLPLILNQGHHAFAKLSCVKNIHMTNVKETLPIKISYVNQKYFYSLIVCPITKQVCTKENKPFLFECGHVISNSAAVSLRE